MSKRMSASGNKPVLWLQVWSLATVQGAIALMWVIYNLYLVDLLQGMGFSTAWATGLLIVENLLAVVMEPLMGNFSDRLQWQMGTRLPLVILGVILAAGVFVGIPAIALQGQSSLRWLLPVVIVMWALAMTVFRSPVLSLLGRYAFATRLPQAASLLTLMGGVAGAMGTVASGVILGWGPLVAFLVGSSVLLAATLVLKWVGGKQLPDVGAQTWQREVAGRSLWSLCPNLGLVFGAGVGITLGFRLMMLLFPRVLNQQVPDARVGQVVSIIFVTLAVTAIPLGSLALKWGNRRAMVVGLAGMVFVGVAMSGVHQSWVAIALAAIFGAGFSLVSNGTIPFALSLVPEEKAGLGTGMFFGGGAAASSLFGTLLDPLQALPLTFNSMLVMASFLLAGVCIIRARSWGAVTEPETDF